MRNQQEYEIQRKREYHRKWRAEHPEAVKAAQMRYWTKKAAEMRSAADFGVNRGETNDQEQLSAV